jgi:hypothetical protein
VHQPAELADPSAREVKTADPASTPQTRLRILATCFARALLRRSTLKPRGRREGRVPAGTRGPLREKHTQENRTAAYRCSQSLGLPCAMVGRLMPCSPGSRTFPLASLTPRIDDAVCPVGLAHIFAKGLTVATTARTTRFCRTHGPPCRRSFPNPVDRAGNLQTRRSLAAPLVARGFELTGTTRPTRTLSCQRCRVHRKPGSRK